MAVVSTGTGEEQPARSWQSLGRELTELRNSLKQYQGELQKVSDSRQRSQVSLQVSLWLTDCEKAEDAVAPLPQDTPPLSCTEGSKEDREPAGRVLPSDVLQSAVLFDHTLQAESESHAEEESVPHMPKRHSEMPTATSERGVRTGTCRARSDSAPVRLRNAQCRSSGNPSCTQSRRRASVDLGEISGTPAMSPSDEKSFGMGEEWSNFLERAASHTHEACIKDEPDALFEAFRSTDDLQLTYASFARLYHRASCWRGTDAGSVSSTSSSCLPPWAASSEVPNRPWRYPYEPIRLMLGGNWKAKKLWALLDARCSKSEYADAPWSSGRLANQRAVIVGAGPCGLRTAIELRLLGAQVTVLERRESFSRINQLHLWSWVGEELKSLGARLLEPPPKDFGADPDKLHVGIADLQKLLLKVALLLGVEVLLGVDYVRTEWSDHDGWRAVLGPPFSAGESAGEGRAGDAGPGVAESKKGLQEAKQGSPSPQAPGFIRNVAVLIGASGFGCDIGTQAGIRSVDTDHMRNESAIGVIVNYARTYNNCERRLRSFSLAKQFYLPLFQKVKEQTGADLENIVYVKGHDSHYFVMTPTSGSLIETGVVIDRTRKPLLERDNIDAGALDRFVSRVASFKFKDEEPTVLEAIRAEGMPQHRSARLTRSNSQSLREAAERCTENSDAHNLNGDGKLPVYADRGPRIFDFSKMHRSATGLTFLTPPTRQSSNPAADNQRLDGATQDDDDLLVLLVGDALIEPFWPEGLGIIRGFFAVLDASAAVQQWALGSSKKATQAYYESAYVQLKTLSAATRARTLRNDEHLYALAPHTRYRQLACTRAVSADPRSSRALDN